MNRYGQLLIWGPLSAPALFTCAPTSWSWDDKYVEQDEADGVGEFLAMILHSRQTDFSFDGKALSGSTDYLDLSDSQAAIAISGIESGISLVNRCVETWELGKSKMASVSGIYFPDMVDASDGPSAASTLNAFTPTQTSPPIVNPGGQIIYGTVGMTQASGILHRLVLTQELKIVPDPPDPTGKILGASVTGYKRTISADILATPSSASAPANGTTLVITNAPAHAGSHIINTVGLRLDSEKGKMYRVGASWIPAF